MRKDRRSLVRPSVFLLQPFCKTFREQKKKRINGNDVLHYSHVYIDTRGVSYQRELESDDFKLFCDGLLPEML